MNIDLRVGDSLKVLKEIESNTIDSVVTDPPYGLSFMGNKWDYDVPTVELWKEALRVLKPGGHLLSFSSSRTYHRMVVNVEDAGFEIRDQIMWVYGSGFPKSHNIGKSYDKKLGNDREEGNTITTKNHSGKGRGPNAALAEHPGTIKYTHTKGTSPYEGWGTALKPAHEPIVLARKPLGEKSVVDNVIKWGTGGINIDKSRVGTEKVHNDRVKQLKNRSLADNVANHKDQYTADDYERTYVEGRFPANFIHDGSDEVLELFPQTAGNHGGRVAKSGFQFGAGDGSKITSTNAKQDMGSAARYFYCAKVSKKERNAGLNVNLPNVPQLSKEEQLERYGVKTDNYVQLINLEQQLEAGVKKEDLNVFAEYGSWFEEKTPVGRDAGQDAMSGPHKPRPVSQANTHPTVKPVKLMNYLVNLVTPIDGTVLDPFMGSGSTGLACKDSGFNFIGIDLDESYVNIARARIDGWKK